MKTSSRVSQTAAMSIGMMVFQIQDITARFYNVTVEAMLSRSRDRTYCWPRQVAIYLTRQNTHLTVRDIGILFARNYGTVLSACAQVSNQMETSSIAACELNYLEGLCLRLKMRLRKA